MDNYSKSFSKIISSIKVRLTQSSALEQLENHPETYSLLAYSDTLSKFKIDNAAIKIDKNQLVELPFPFVTYHARNGGTFILIRSLKNDLVSWYDSKKGWRKDDINEFVKDWNGIALLTEVGENSGELNYLKARGQELLQISRKALAIILLVVALGLIVSKINLSGPQLILPFILLAGVSISTLLLIQSFGFESKISDKICNSGGKVNECQNILESTSSKITPWLSLSDIGIIYFTSTFLYFLLAQFKIVNYQGFQSWIFYTSILGIFFSFYSIYLQGYVLKMWCKLCLMTISLFYLQLGSLFLLDINLVSSIIPHLIFSEVLLASSLPMAFLLISKYSFINAATLAGTLKKLKRLQTNPKVLNALFDGQRSLPNVPQILSPIKFGNQEASNVITIVSNPLCSPCASMHSTIEDLVFENSDIKCQVIFLCSEDSKNVGYKFLNQLFSIPLNLQEQAMNDWYKSNTRDFETWLKPYKSYPILSSAKVTINSHKTWVNKAEIKSTPTLFLNGKQMPETLKLEDLISFNMSAINSNKAYQEV
jgi:uncharacterized membrane protein